MLSNYKKSLFLSILLHSLLFYLLALNLPKPVSDKRALNVIFAIESPKVEKTEAVERKVNELSPSRILRRNVVPLSPLDNFKITNLMGSDLNFEPKAIVSRVKVPAQRPESLEVDSIRTPYRDFKPYHRSVLSSQLKLRAYFSNGTKNLHNSPVFLKSGDTGKVTPISISQRASVPVPATGLTLGKYYSDHSFEMASIPRPSQKTGKKFFQVALEQGVTQASFGIKPSAVVKNRSQGLASLQMPSGPRVTGETKGAKQRFTAMVLGKVERSKIYPEIAKRMMLEGEVLIGFTIFPEGKVDMIEVISATRNHKALNTAAVNTIRKAAPYTPVPLELRREEGVRFSVKISYKLN